MVQTNECLEEANADNDQKHEENGRLAHHDLHNHHHRAEEAEGIEIEQETSPEQWRGAGKEVVRELVESMAILCIQRVTEGNHPQHEGCGEDTVQREVEDVPEANVISSHLPDLRELIAKEAKGEDVQQALDSI